MAETAGAVDVVDGPGVDPELYAVAVLHAAVAAPGGWLFPATTTVKASPPSLQAAPIGLRRLFLHFREARQTVLRIQPCTMIGPDRMPVKAGQ